MIFRLSQYMLCNLKGESWLLCLKIIKLVGGSFFITIISSDIFYFRLNLVLGKQGYYNSALDFFPANNFVHRITEICGHIQMISTELARPTAVIQQLASTTEFIIVLQLKIFLDVGCFFCRLTCRVIISVIF